MQNFSDENESQETEAGDEDLEVLPPEFWFPTSLQHADRQPQISINQSECKRSLSFLNFYQYSRSIICYYCSLCTRVKYSNNFYSHQKDVEKSLKSKCLTLTYKKK